MQTTNKPNPANPSPKPHPGPRARSFKDALAAVRTTADQVQAIGPAIHHAAAGDINALVQGVQNLLFHELINYRIGNPAAAPGACKQIAMLAAAMNSTALARDRIRKTNETLDAKPKDPSTDLEVIEKVRQLLGLPPPPPEPPPRKTKKARLP